MMIWLTIFLVGSFTAVEKINVDEIVKVNAPRAVVKAGKHLVIRVGIEVMDGYHIQSNKVDNEFIIPTTLEINSDKEINVKRQVFPSTKKFKLEGTEEYLDVYDGRFEIKIFINTQKKIQRGIYELKGKLKYQPCDSMRCSFPRTLKFSLDIDVQ